MTQIVFDPSWPRRLKRKLRKARQAQERRDQERKQLSAAMDAYRDRPSVLIKKTEAKTSRKETP
jgi:hypothetical protein